MRLIHYSPKPLPSVRSRKHSTDGAGAYKTPGLWVSVEGEYDWVWWCKAESFGLDGFKHATEVVLTADANVHHLKTPGDIERFTVEFTPKDRPSWDNSIDWPAVRAKWRGLIIAPYCWPLRMARHTSWYYGWDCASGVIWDAAAVAELRPIDPPDMTAEEEAA